MKDLGALVSRARDGDAESFGAVVRRFQDMAVGYGYALLGDLGLAEDASQEAFLEAYLCLPNLREPAAFPGWFRRIVFKQCDRVRRGKLRQFVPIETAAERELQKVNSPIVGLEKASDQVEAMQQREMKDQVWAAIDLLPKSERTVVTLYYLSGYSQREVATFLELPVGTIKKRLFTARGRLREMLVDLVDDTLRQQRPSRDEGFAASVMDMLAAARAGDAARVKELLQQNPRLLTARDWLGNTALIVAVNSGHQAVAEMLYKAGVQPDIYEAAAIGQMDRLEQLLSENPQQVNSFSEEGFTPLGLAAHFGHQDTTNFLISKGADINVLSRHRLQVTPLHAALFGRQTKTALLLIERGADVMIKRGGNGWPRAGWTALHYAAASGFMELIPPIVSRMTDINLRDEEGKTPLTVAIEQKQEAVADWLRQSGAEE
jgi:RNA polymerase sigma factor (sigma-70 family)